MCNLYSITTNQAAIIALFRVMNRYVGNLAPMPGVFPDYPAPVIRNTADGSELAMMRWGMPPPPRNGGPPVTNIRNTSSPHWRDWLKPESRCLVPANSFAEYTRPFVQSRGAAAPLTLKMVDLKLSKDRQALHDRLMDMRNKIMAHSDSEMMRMTTEPFDVSMQNGEPPVYLIQMVFDEGITLHGTLLIETNELLHEVYQATYRTLHKELQTKPELFNLRIDSEAARAARNMNR
jgi:SOS response associated peptidase (SRAP)